MLRLGLIAQDLRASVTPLVYRAMAADVDVPISYKIRNVEPSDFPAAITRARTEFDGMVVTMPYKRTVLAYADRLDESARACGSANVLRIKNKKITAYSTDGWGVVKYLSFSQLSFEGSRVVLFGAGGVAHSIAYQLVAHGASEVDVLDQKPQEAEALCTRFGKRFTPYPLRGAQLRDCCDGADYFLNATSLGQLGCGDFEDLSFLAALPEHAVVVDLNYANPGARLVPAALARGLRAFDGKGVAACHALRAIEIWAGKTPSDEAARELIRSFGSR